MIPCPHCAIALVPNDRILGCTQCRGAWVPARALDEHLGKQPAYTPSPHAAVACPVCRAAMSAVALGGVELDRCAADGVWFDADELDRIRNGRPAGDSDRDQGGRNTIMILIGFFDSWF
jgi:Zn-finger nucleic acid-binding protein